MDVVAVTPDEWRRWRALRQAALAEAPAAFSSTVAEWSGAGDTEERWRARLTDVPHNLVLVEDGRDVGMVSLAAPAGDGCPELISMWVAPAVRGTGVADAAVEALLDLAARTRPGQAVTLSVYEHNAAARRLYARHGFVDVGPSPDDQDERRMVRAAAASPAGSGHGTSDPADRAGAQATQERTASTTARVDSP